MSGKYSHAVRINDNNTQYVTNVYSIFGLYCLYIGCYQRAQWMWHAISIQNVFSQTPDYRRLVSSIYHINVPQSTQQPYCYKINFFDNKMCRLFDFLISIGDENGYMRIARASPKIRSDEHALYARQKSPNWCQTLTWPLLIAKFTDGFIRI